MRRKHLTFGIVFLLLCSVIALVAVSQQKSIRQLEAEKEAAWNALYLEPHGAWPRYKAKFDFYEGKIQKFITEHGKLTGTKLSPKLDWGSALVDGIDKNITAYYLSDSLRTLLGEIDKAGNEASFFYIDVVLKAWYEYYDAVGAYNAEVSPEERISIQQPSEYAATPIFLCQGSCDARFETALAAQVSHQVSCSEKHGTSGTMGVPFYLCSGSCDRADEHWRVCGGTCGKKFAPKRISHSQGRGGYSWVDNSPHYITCQAYHYRSFWESTVCGEQYYTCVGSCDNGHSNSSSSSPVASPTPTPTPTPPSPSYHACGEHETTVSGDHSLQASCTSTDSNGNTCTVTSFYACDGHTHSYPSSEYCWCGGVDYVTCDGCGATYHLCTSANGGCPSSADGYHYRAN